MSETFWFLKRCDLFRRLSSEELRELEGRSLLRKFPRRGLIYVPADHADGVLLLIAGRVQIGTITDEGKQVVLAFIEPGELFGELAVVESGEREDYAEAVEASTVALLPADAVQQLMAVHADVSVGVTKLIGLRRRRVERRLKYLLFRSNRERLVHLLLELVEQYGQSDAAGWRIGMKLSHQDLANVIGATRETVTLELGHLQLAGLLRVGRQKIVVRDLERLAQSVGATVPHVVCPHQQTSAVTRR